MQFRNLVLWLEDQKIRNYKIDERENLRQLQNNDVWNKAFEKVCNNILVANVHFLCEVIAITVLPIF